MSEIIRAWLLQPIMAALQAMQVSISNLQKEITMKQAELAEQLTAVSVTLGVISDESKALIAEVAALKEALTTAGQTTPEVDAALAAVVARTAAIDALVPNV